MPATHADDDSAQQGDELWIGRAAAACGTGAALASYEEVQKAATVVNRRRAAMAARMSAVDCYLLGIRDNRDSHCSAASPTDAMNAVKVAAERAAAFLKREVPSRDAPVQPADVFQRPELDAGATLSSSPPATSALLNGKPPSAQVCHSERLRACMLPHPPPLSRARPLSASTHSTLKHTVGTGESYVPDGQRGKPA